MWDKLAVIRSVISVDEHSDSLVSTGFSENKNRTSHHPSFGSVMSRLRADQANDIPPFVSLRGSSMGLEPGYLGIAHRAYTSEGQGINNLRLPSGVNSERVEMRKDLLSRFDSIRRDIDATGSMTGIDSFTSRAFDMVASGVVRKALDLTQEDPRTRDRYHGVEQFLTARRLVEAGVGCVTLAYGGWDTHEGNFKSLRRQLPELDRGIANLIQDLHDRGMADDVVTVMWGEFGRTPKVNKDAGRDHWGPAGSLLFAGAGVRPGLVLGKTDKHGAYTTQRPVGPADVAYTILDALGIDPRKQLTAPDGRPIEILDQGDAVKELFA
jgi:hypothetical protein